MSVSEILGILLYSIENTVYEECKDATDSSIKILEDKLFDNLAVLR